MSEWLVGADPARWRRRTRRSRSASLPDELVDQLDRRVAVDLPGADGGARLGLAATPVFAVPILAQGQLAGVVALLDATGASNPTRNSLETLAAQVGLALESAALTESHAAHARARRA